MARKRGKNLNDKDIKTIVEILDGWTGKLTWELLIQAVELRLFNRYTRQTLYQHERIRHAFEQFKAEKTAQPPDVRNASNSPELQAALDRNSRLEAENHRLEAENNRLLELFVRWAYNAHVRGVSKEFLNRPLPPINRGQTSK